MRLTQVAAQLYTIHPHCQNAADLARSIAKLRAIGYSAVQLSAVGPIPEPEILAIMAGEGMAICATHEPPAMLLSEPERCIDRLRRLGCKLTAYPYPSNVDLGSAEAVRGLIAQLDAAGAKFHAAGLTLGYHNHAIEFVRHEGRPLLEHIFAQTDPRHLASELDTYWIHYGGGDVLEWCRRLRGRLPFIHLKDYGYSLENTPVDCEIGEGTLPFARIVAEAEAGGCEWFIVEQDKPRADPFESLRMSFEYLKNHLAT